MKETIPRSFYVNDNVIEIAEQLLGKVLVTKINGIKTSGIITETEAYSYKEKACHAYLNKRTKRTDIMFEMGGKAYVYLCYGLHNMFNIVTNQAGKAEAVLIRSIEPYEGVSAILKRRNSNMVKPHLFAGPGKVSQALGITRTLNKTKLYPVSNLSVRKGEQWFNSKNKIWLEPSPLKNVQVLVGKRIGIDYAAEDANLPWRFAIKNSKFVSYINQLK